MPTELSRIQSQIDELQTAADGVGTALIDAAGQLRDSGAAPDGALVDRLSWMRKSFDNLARELKDDSDHSPLASLPELSDRFAAVTRVREVKPILDDILAMRHAEDEAFAPLAKCQEEAASLNELLEQPDRLDDPDLQALRDKSHGLCSLLAIVNADNELDDDAWTDANEKVTNAWGRALATAAARGRLEIKR